MEIEARSLGSVYVLHVSGQVRSGAHDELRDVLHDWIEDGRKRFVLNLTRTVSLDSMALGELVACFKRARERGGDVKLVVTPDGIVHELLQLTRLDRVFEIFGDEAEAAASFVLGPS